MRSTEEVKTFRSLSESSLVERITALSEEEMRLRFRRASSQLDNTARLKHLRRSIARAKTVLNEKTNL